VRVRLNWESRPTPLAADGVAGVGEIGKALARRLLARGDWVNFRGVSGATVLILLGRDPPWAEGAVYLGRSPNAPGLWLPTRLKPIVDESLVSRKLQSDGLVGPVALLPEQGIAVPLGEARPVDEGLLRAWLDE